MPRHAPGDGMDGEANLASVGLQLLRELSQGVLGLGDGQTVTGNKNH